MSNTSEHSSSSHTEVYSIELDGNPKNDNITHIGDNRPHTVSDRSKSEATREAWTEDSSIETHGIVHDLWLEGKSVVTAANQAINQWIDMLKNSSWFPSAVTAANQAMNQWIVMLKDSSWFQHWYGPIIVALATTSSMIFTLWPQHNSILHPEYWYEMLGRHFMWILCIQVPLFLTVFNTVMKVDLQLTWRKYFKLFLWFFLGRAVPYVILHIIWVYMFHLRHPLPFLEGVVELLHCGFVGVSLWFFVPKDLRLIIIQSESKFWLE